MNLDARAVDDELLRVVRPFRAAWLRMAQAETIPAGHDEMSNCLHHLYRLGELVARRHGATTRQAVNDCLGATDYGRAALASMWIRQYDAHELAITAEPSGVIAEMYTARYDVLAWQSLDAMPFTVLPAGTHRTIVERREHYRAHLEGNVVLSTNRDAANELTARRGKPAPRQGTTNVA